jgi:CubicO group peptidase (beta-lactamase class C family)
LLFWEKDPQGYYFGGNGMQFTSRDMAKFGLLYLHNGLMNGTQIVPSLWIEESLTPSTYIGGVWGDLLDAGYGYGWWLGTINGYHTFLALGHGGQYIITIPDLDIIVVTTANPDFDWDTADLHERTLLHITAEFIIPAVI